MLFIIAIFTVRNQVAKVMFLHLSVISVHKGGSASVHAGIPPRPTPPPGSRHPPEHTPQTRHPPGRWLLLRTVPILLECILVIFGPHKVSQNLPG